LAELFFTAFGGSSLATLAPDTPERQLEQILEPISVLFNLDQTTAFVVSLEENELTMARRGVRALFEDVPAIYGMHAFLFGRSAAGDMLRSLTKEASVPLRAFCVIGLAWLLRRHGTAAFETLMPQIERVLPQAKAMCEVARAFPEHRTLLFQRNHKYLAQLPKETQERMLAILKPAMT
jgi:hypothetical protein